MPDDGPDHAALVEVFVGFARRASGRFAVDDVLRDLAVAAARILAVDGAAVTYRSGDRMEVVATTTAPVQGTEAVQEAAQDGPCYDAAATSALVVEEHLAEHPERWPRFVARAVSLGLHAVAAVPLRARGRVWGALDLYRAEPGPFGPGDLATAEVLAEVACGYVVTAHDHDAARLAQQRAAHAATHDALTGLPNRALLHDRLDHAIAAARRRGSPLAVLFLDLDGFKAVNDVHGHQVGDRFLVEVASRLSGVVRAGDTLARLGGDEFVVVCEGLHPGPAGRVAPGSLSAVLDRVREALAAPVRLGELELLVGASIGVAALDDRTRDGDALLGAADRAMYRAKGERSGARREAGGGVRIVIDLGGSPGEGAEPPAPAQAPGRENGGGPR